MSVIKGTWTTEQLTHFLLKLSLFSDLLCFLNGHPAGHPEIRQDLTNAVNLLRGTRKALELFHPAKIWEARVSLPRQTNHFFRTPQAITIALLGHTISTSSLSEGKAHLQLLELLLIFILWAPGMFKQFSLTWILTYHRFVGFLT
jgi:hypothetical protein